MAVSERELPYWGVNTFSGNVKKEQELSVTYKQITQFAKG